MLLGLLKGILGIVGFHKLGRWGLEMLIDLPKPLDRYQERDLKHKTVCYDVAGWPVHPETGERTVRLLPMQTEFFLNIIFFLAYPLALVLKLCSFCCCIKNTADDETCYRQVNIIRCKSQVDPKNGPNMDIYQENDLREANDTNYVINCMKQSHISLEKLRNTFH
ncbi:hypothetical protein GWI33_018799 [Rhynchophorus ferrugineus]|uniref:Uncharacterized protein n=1 Tax=Rhynchophorus ferrugineus TaxID=354439 RepID=A0A834HW92_RHYFE|nr:hypothetical protein GWI33_018799 [Rhynchophorus ferrugineus]